MNTATNTLKSIGNGWSILRDRVIAFLAVSILTLLFLESRQALESLQFMGNALFNIAPYFILAIAFAAYSKASGMDQLIVKAFSGNILFTIFAASLAGALSPFCSCGVIPLIAAMLASGVPLPPVMAFCIASPIMDPEMFILTASGISLPFAIAKTITAMGMGILSGFFVWSLQKAGYLGNPLKKNIGCGCGQPVFDPQKPVEISWRFWRTPDKKESFFNQIGENGLFLGKWMALAFFIESLMVAYIPEEFMRSLLGDHQLLSIPLASVIGVPAYMNGYAAIPLISGLMDLGMTHGAALSFATAGAVSSIPAALAVYALVKRPVFFVYIIIGLVGSMTAGFLYQLVHYAYPSF